MAAAAAVLVAVGAASAVALLDGGGDDDPPATTVPDTTSAPPTTDGTDDPTTTTTGGGDGTDLAGGLGGGLAGSGSSEPVGPLPGDDWNDDARAHWVAGCGPDLEATSGGVVTDGGTTCGCIYDAVEAEGISFAEFNEQVSAEDMDMDSPVVSVLNSAIFSCAT
jgi:hypothetical protein